MNGTAARQQYYFDAFDYSVFGGMLVLSVLTGLYHGCRGRKKLTTRKYLMGSNMQVFPVAMSLIASYVSGVTILGTPAEIYNYGTQYWIIVVSIWIMGLLVSLIYLPVFRTLNVSSSYEYLEMRFDRRVRTLAGVMFILDEIMFLPILIYVPALAFNQVTGVNIHVIGSVVCVVCVFYTVIGGLKAVVWTDTLQISVMFMSVLVVVAVGTHAAGGVAEVWRKAARGRRLVYLDTSSSMYRRHTALGVLIGETFYWTAFNSVNQTMVQRYLSLSELKQSRRSLLVFTAGVSVFVSICCYSGLLIYSAYGDCDPKTSGLVTSDDQLLPVYVMRTVGHIPGLPGLFVAGVFGAALSSLSVVLNSTAAVLLQDFAKGFLRLELSDKKATVVAKSSALLLGALALACVYVVEHLGGILATASSLSAIAAGTTFGLFSLGMLVPWAEPWGALCGALCGALLSGWVSLGSQYANAAGLVRPHKLPLGMDGCVPNITVDMLPVTVDESAVFPLYRLSYHWITPIGTCTVLLVGMLVSWAKMGSLKGHVDAELLSPVVRWGAATKGRCEIDDASSQQLNQETSFTES